MKYMEDEQISPTTRIELEDDGAEVIRRRMRYVEDDTNSLRDSAAQTDSDSLVDHIQVHNWVNVVTSRVFFFVEISHFRRY